MKIEKLNVVNSESIVNFVERNQSIFDFLKSDFHCEQKNDLLIFSFNNENIDLFSRLIDSIMKSDEKYVFENVKVIDSEFYELDSLLFCLNLSEEDIDSFFKIAE